jgi:hypothetical protein
MSSFSSQQASSRPLVVFDLNGCLCKTDFDGKEYGNMGYDFKVRRKNVYVRPFTHTMLATVTANYDIAVWTCNGRQYAEQIAKQIFRRYFSSLRFLWTAEECDLTPGSTNANECNMRKNLRKIFNCCGDTSLVVMVDDTEEKILKCNVDGRISKLVVISTFFPRGDNIDTELLDLPERIDNAVAEKV